MADEALQRLRRIETRLTQLLVASGIDTHKQQPEPIADGPAQALRLPSPHTSIKEVLSALPSGWTGPIQLYIGSDRIGSIDLDRT